MDESLPPSCLEGIERIIIVIRDDQNKDVKHFLRVKDSLQDVIKAMLMIPSKIPNTFAIPPMEFLTYVLENYSTEDAFNLIDKMDNQMITRPEMNIVGSQDLEKRSKENEITNLTEINDEIDNETGNGCVANITLENPKLIADERSKISSRINDSSNKMNKNGTEKAQKMSINRNPSSKDNKEPQKGLSGNRKLNEPSKIMSDSRTNKPSILPSAAYSSAHLTLAQIICTP